MSASSLVGNYQFRVAIKLVYDVVESRRRDLDREAVILQRLDSPHVVKLKEAGYAARDYAYWFVTDFIAGKSLQQLQSAGHPFDEDLMVELARQVLAGLTVIHVEKILHCDVKPANIMRNEGRRGEVRYVLVDFGVARAYQAGASLYTLHNFTGIYESRGLPMSRPRPGCRHLRPGGHPLPDDYGQAVLRQLRIRHCSGFSRRAGSDAGAYCDQLGGGAAGNIAI